MSYNEVALCNSYYFKKTYSLFLGWLLLGQLQHLEEGGEQIGNLLREIVTIYKQTN